MAERNPLADRNAAQLADTRARLDRAIAIQRQRGHTIVADLLATMDQMLAAEERRRQAETGAANGE